MKLLLVVVLGGLSVAFATNLLRVADGLAWLNRKAVLPGVWQDPWARLGRRSLYWRWFGAVASLVGMVVALRWFATG